MTRDQRISGICIGLLCALSVGLFVWLVWNDETVEDAESLVDEFASLLEAHALRGTSVNWIDVRREVTATLPTRARESDVYHAYRLLVGALGDKHTHHVPRERYEQLKLEPNGDAAPAEFVAARLDDAGNLHLKIGRYSAIHPDQFSRDGLAALSRVESILPMVRCGVIVDLSENAGGNMMPMFLASIPFLGRGELIGYVNRDGKRESFRWGTSLDEATNTWGVHRDQVAAAVARLSQWRSEKRAPLAIVQSTQTGSSGESILIALRGQDRTKSFGQNSAGFATGNTLFALRDGSAAAITTTRMSDRTGRIYGDFVPPDVETKSVDEALRRATSHLQEECAAR